MTMNTTRGYVRTEDTAHLDTEALSLRSTGLDYRTIGAQVGCDPSTAYRRCQRALGEIPREEADEYRALENLRLDALWEVAYERALVGNLAAIDRCLAIMARRAKLNGLDAPSRLNVEQDIYSGDFTEALEAKVAELEELDRIKKMKAGDEAKASVLALLDRLRDSDGD